MQRGRTTAADSTQAPMTRPGANRNLETEAPRNIILFVADGMGPEHVKAGRHFAGGPLVFETLPYSSTMTTDSVDGVTDSAASATAMATGERVENGVISVALPGDGSDLSTALEWWQARGSRTGLVTTSYMTDATPAAFGAHEPSRANREEIAIDYLQDSRPNVLLGGGGQGMAQEEAEAAGYTVVTDKGQMLALDASSVAHLSGQFGDGALPPINDGRPPLPSLAEMTETALDVLEESPNGFFLLVEQEGTDTYSHGNNLELMVDALMEFDEAVTTALTWADNTGDTLIIVTADHETGGLTVLQDNGPGALPDVSWDTTGHTRTPVPVYGDGPGAERVAAVADVTEVYDALTANVGAAYRVYAPVLQMAE